jgi:hypothetical protein
MIVSRREHSWLDDGRRRLHVRLRALGRLRTPVLVVAAALFGAAISAVVWVGLWNREAGSRHTAEAALAASQKHARALASENTRLRGRLVDSRTTSARLEQSSARLQAAAQTLVRENATLVASAGKLHGRGGSLERRSLLVSKLAAALGNDLVSVLAYITNTSIGSLDPSYLKAQLDYLRPAVANVRSAAEGLGADASTYAAAVDGFAAEAAAYETALRKLAGEQAKAR